jgi:acetyl-CoA synthetase
MASQSAASFRAARDFLLAHSHDYATAYKDFRWPELDRFNWALDWFDPFAAGNSAPALHIVDEGAGETKHSFAELKIRSDQVANFLRELGVQRGDRVLLMLGNVTPLWETMLAAMKLGAVVIPATTLLVHEDLLDRFERGRVKHVIAASDCCEKFDGITGDWTRIAVGPDVAGWRNFVDSNSASSAFTQDGETRADDPLLLYFTSGTTAKPKLVLHSHRSYPVGSLSTMYWIGAREGDVHMNISSPGWAKHAWSCVFAPWNAGACIFVLNQPRFAARGLLDILVSAKVTTFCAPPTVWRMLIQEDLTKWKPAIREIVGAGEPLNPEVIERVRNAWNVTIRDGYGQTETTCQVANPPGEEIVLGSMGRPMPGYRVRLLDLDGNDAEEGEICLALDGEHPCGLMRGYQKGDEIEPIEGDVYRTGDVAQRDATGRLAYVGRADDVFKASDYRISPFELESALIEHPAVAEAAVVPSHDPLRHAVPKAFLSLVPGHTADAATARSILAHARAVLAPYKRVRRIEFAELPKTISGKIRRVELRRAEAKLREGTTRAPAEFWEEDFPDLKS